MKRILLLFLIATQVTDGQTRTTGNATTAGSCSPSITGGNNKIELTCNGISKQKADQLVNLMNALLERNVDLTKVYDDLDQIQASLKQLDLATDPLSHASASERALLDEGEANGRDCGAFGQQWLSAIEQARQQQVADRYSLLQQRTRNQQTPEISQMAMEYRKTELPELLIWKQYLSAVPSARGLLDKYDPESVTRDVQLMLVCNAYSSLTKQAQPVIAANDFAIMQAEAKHCTEFWSKWQQSRFAISADVPNPNGPMELDSAKAAQYHSTLSSKLETWRLAVFQQIPNKSGLSSYLRVSNLRELNAVCADVYSLYDAYQKHVIQEVRQAVGPK